MTEQKAPEPAPASHAWCLVCRGPQPFEARLIHPASLRVRSSFEAIDMVCKGCNVVLATIYVKAA